MFPFPYHLILGSLSPRRKTLLEGLDLPFETRGMANIEEDYPLDLALEEIPLYIAAEKAIAYIPDLKDNDLLITADTVVIVSGEVLGKPGNRQEAQEMLEKLSDSGHTVVTGVAFSRPNGIHKLFSSRSEVYFAKLEKEEINYYLDKYKPYDKAGSYGIQEWLGYVAIRRIDGSFYNVMGLPIHLIYQTLKEWTEYEKKVVSLLPDSE